MELTDIIRALPDMEFEDVQTVWREAQSETQKRFAERRRRGCRHPETHRQQTERPRQGLLTEVCTFCWTYHPGDPEREAPPAQDRAIAVRVGATKVGLMGRLFRRRRR